MSDPGSEAVHPDCCDPRTERGADNNGSTGFWHAGPGLDELDTRPYAADDPAALPRGLGRLPGDSDGSATEELLHIYAVLADAAEHEALKGADR